MEFLDFVIILVSGILFGITFSLVIFTALSHKKIRRERLAANILFYRDMLSKKENKKHQYKDSTRLVINHVHASILVQAHESDPLPMINSSESKIAYFPSKRINLGNA